MMKSVKKTFSHPERAERSIMVIGDPTWRAGVLGLVAGKIVDEFKKPAFVWGLEGGTVIKGSCRSDGTVNIVEMMGNLAENSLLEFGGHAGAGGFSVSHEEIHFLEERLIEAYDKTTKISVESEETITFDDKLTLDEVNEKTFNEIDRLAPFGVGNPKPIFMFDDIEIADIKIFGKAKDHLELAFKDSRGRTVKAISFFKKPEDFGDRVKHGERINLLATIEKSMFGYKKEIRLRIVEIQ
jgi:single-stranded-DNA-specific exonuclease